MLRILRLFGNPHCRDISKATACSALSGKNVIGACSWRPVFQKGRRTVTLVRGLPWNCVFQRSRTRFSQYREQSCSVLLEFDEGTAHFDGPTTSKYSCRCAGFRSSTHRKSASHSDTENRPNLGSVRSVTVLARGVWGSEQ
jgi:hypothetical protein